MNNNNNGKGEGFRRTFSSRDYVRHPHIGFQNNARVNPMAGHVSVFDSIRAGLQRGSIPRDTPGVVHFRGPENPLNTNITPEQRVRNTNQFAYPALDPQHVTATPVQTPRLYRVQATPVSVDQLHEQAGQAMRNNQRPQPIFQASHVENTPNAISYHNPLTTRPMTQGEYQRYLENEAEQERRLHESFTDALFRFSS